MENIVFHEDIFRQSTGCYIICAKRALVQLIGLYEQRGIMLDTVILHYTFVSCCQESINCRFRRIQKECYYCYIHQQLNDIVDNEYDLSIGELFQPIWNESVIKPSQFHLSWRILTYLEYLQHETSSQSHLQEMLKIGLDYIIREMYGDETTPYDVQSEERITTFPTSWSYFLLIIILQSLTYRPYVGFVQLLDSATKVPVIHSILLFTHPIGYSISCDQEGCERCASYIPNDNDLSIRRCYLHDHDELYPIDVLSLPEPVSYTIWARCTLSYLLRHYIQTYDYECLHNAIRVVYLNLVILLIQISVIPSS